MDISNKDLTFSLNTDELERYKRHITLKEIGLQGQKYLKNSAILFVGAGGLGSSAILYIAASGIGKIGIIDNDKVEKSNLQRQIIHDSFSIGQNKTESAKKKIQELNPHCIVKIFTKRLSQKNAMEIISEFDIVCDCSDNFPTRYLVNDTCIILNKPMIYASVQGFEGQLSVFNLNNNSPNLRDLLPKSPQSQNIPSCEQYGVMGISTGLIGVLQANEIIKIVTKTGKILDGEILIFNLLTMTMKKLHLKANKKYKEIPNLEVFNNFYQELDCKINNQNIKTIALEEFKKLYRENLSKILIIDVREEEEFKSLSLNGSISLPLDLVEKKSSLTLIKKNSIGKKIYTICKKGIRSENASRILMSHQINSISIEGGIDNLIRGKFFD